MTPYTVMANASMPGWWFVLHTDGIDTEVVSIVRGDTQAIRIASLLNRHGMVDAPLDTLPQ